MVVCLTFVHVDLYTHTQTNTKHIQTNTRLSIFMCACALMIVLVMDKCASEQEDSVPVTFGPHVSIQIELNIQNPGFKSFQWYMYGSNR